jgi:hypothetical protein
MKVLNGNDDFFKKKNTKVVNGHAISTGGHAIHDFG